MDAGYLVTIVTQRIEPWIRAREIRNAPPKVDKQITMGW
jgi:hypothetical protein